jgi:hypothetical protein
MSSLGATGLMFNGSADCLVTLSFRKTGKFLCLILCANEFAGRWVPGMTLVFLYIIFLQ